MSDEPKFSPPRTFDEAERLRRSQERIDEINAEINAEFGEGTISATVGYLDDAEIIEQIDASESAVFIGADGYSWYRAGALPVLPSVEISGLDYLEGALRAGRVQCRHFGIGKEIEGVDVGLFAHFRLSVVVIKSVDDVALKQLPLYIWLRDAPEEWIAHAMKRFVVVWPPGADGQRVYMATGPMAQFPDGVRVAPDVTRNSPCPCGSGRKFKKCHGA